LRQLPGNAWLSCRIAVISLVVGLVLGAAVTTHAQFGGGVGVSSGGSRARVSGIRQRGNATELRTPDDAAFSPTAFSFYRSGVEEPTEPNVMWWACDEQARVVTCQEKINWQGVTLVAQEVSAKLP
jgi:hypothetical protein